MLAQVKLSMVIFFSISHALSKHSEKTKVIVYEFENFQLTGSFRSQNFLMAPEQNHSQEKGISQRIHF